jgi:hypothetical protein
MRRRRVLKTRYFQTRARASHPSDGPMALVLRVGDLLALSEDQIDDQTKSGAVTEIIG